MSYSNYNREHRRSRLQEPAMLTEDSNFWAPTTDKKAMLGCIFDLDDGRRFRYQQSGEALIIGLVNQSAVGTANWQNEVQTNSPRIPAVGDMKITFTATSTAAKDAFVDGYLTIEDGVGETNMYVIKSNKAGTANATTGFDIVIEIADISGIRTAWEAASELTVTVNKYKDVIVFPTDPTGTATGVNLTAIASGSFFWGQTLGPCPCVKDSTDTIIVGDPCAIAPNTAGQIGLLDVVAEGDVLAGYVMRASGSAETSLIDLRLE